MELRNEFSVGVPVDKAWALVTDLEQIVPCMAGAKLEGVEEGAYLGLVKVKVGPITSSYRGTATFVERDEVNHRAVFRARGRDARGQGDLKALITVRLEPDGERTRVTVVTDLAITGKVARFGRGALTDVSTKMLGQFVENVETGLLGERPPSDESTTTARVPHARNTDPEPVDLLRTVGIPPGVRFGVPAVVLGSGTAVATSRSTQAGAVIP